MTQRIWLDFPLALQADDKKELKLIFENDKVAREFSALNEQET